MSARLAAAGLLLALLALAGCGDGESDDSAVPLVAGGYLATWSPDGGTLAVPGPDEIELVAAGGSGSRRIPAPGIHLEEGALGWSAGGDALHYLANPAPGEADFAAAVLPIGGGEPRRIPLELPVYGAAWAPGGWPLAFVPNSNVFGGKRGRRGPEPELWLLEGPESRPRRLLEPRGTERAVGTRFG